MGGGDAAYALLTDLRSFEGDVVEPVGVEYCFGS